MHHTKKVVRLSPWSGAAPIYEVVEPPPELRAPMTPTNRRARAITRDLRGSEATKGSGAHPEGNHADRRLQHPDEDAASVVNAVEAPDGSRYSADRRRFSRLVVAGAVAVGLFLAWLAFGFGGEAVTTAVDDIGAGVVAFLAGAACLRRATRHEGRTARGWRLLGWSALSWGLGEVVWAYYEVVAGREVPFPSLPDVGFLLAVPLALGAMLAFFSPPVGWTSRLRLVTDALIVDASVLYVSWVLVLGPLYHAGEGGLLAQAISLAYPAGDVVILSVVVLVAARGRATADLPLGWIAAGLVALAVSDSAFAYLTEQGTYATNLLDTGWFAGFVLIALAASKPPAAGRPRDSGRRQLTLLPYVPAVAVLVMKVARAVAGATPADFLFFNWVAVVVFLMVRQVLTLRENQSLTCDLEAKVEARTLALSRSEERFRSLIQNVSDIIGVVAADGEIRYVSPSIEAVSGYPPTEIVGRNIYDFLHPDDTPTMAAFLAGMGGASRRMEVRLRDRRGDWRDFEVVGTDMSHEPALGGFVLAIRDETERKSLEDQLAHQAFHDRLTGLANRALLADRIDHGLARIGRTGRDLAVVFVDVDDFKAVNDTLGHASGDALLQEVSRRLQGCVRPGDTVARLGGDEFAVLMEDAEEDVAVAVATRLQEALRAAVSLGPHEVHVSASAGIALSGPETTSASEVLRNADVAMYQAKADGKGGHQVFRAEMHEALVRRAELLGELRLAVERSEFTLHYQPLVDLTSGGIVGFEALVRWQHPTRGMVPPNEFIPLAEETGLIVPIGHWVLEEAVARLRAFDAVERRDPPLTMSVNVSGRQFGRPDLVPAVADALARSGIDPARLTLELTESILFEDGDSTITRLAELKALGVHLAIDDFGTGFSSLSYLQRYPIDSLKIDKSFVDAMDTSRGAELVRTVIELGSVLGITTVAEGIEHSAQLDALQALGCQLGQGFMFSRPVPDAQVGALLEADAAKGASVVQS